MEDSQWTSTDDEARRHARRRRLVVVVLVNVAASPRRFATKSVRENELVLAPYTIQSLFADGVNLCRNGEEVTARRRDDVELSPRRTSDGPAWREKDISGNGVRKRQAEFLVNH